MIQRKLKLCKGPCGQMKMIWARGMCQECDRKANPPAPIKRVNIVVKRKKTGEYDLFLVIWAERPHKCQCCSQPLGDEMKPLFMSHLLTKGAYPALRLVKLNIMIMCPTCHHEWDNVSKMADKFKLPRLIAERLKREYYDEKHGNR